MTVRHSLQPGGPAASLYLTLFGILASLVSTFWAFGYVRMSRKLRGYMHAGPGTDVPRIRKVSPSPFLPPVATLSSHFGQVIGERSYTPPCAHRPARRFMMYWAVWGAPSTSTCTAQSKLTPPASAHNHACRAADRIGGLRWAIKVCLPSTL